MADPDDDEPMVLGPEHELSDDEVEGDLPSARVIAVDLEGDAQAQVDAVANSSEEPAPIDAANLRKLYELELRALPRDERLALAHQSQGAQLLALCLDPEPQVIDALFDNALAGLAHARLAARHHGTSTGLDLIARRAQYLRDPQVQRALLRNVQTGEGLLRRILGSRPLREVYKVCLDRDLPSKQLSWVRAHLRARFAQASAEERVDLIVSTEARCLTLLIGQTFDQHTTTLLCHRQYNSSLFVQNLARFSACPPLLLAHLLKQPFVKRQPQLRKLLTQHPNMPSQLKR